MAVRDFIFSRTGNQCSIRDESLLTRAGQAFVAKFITRPLNQSQNVLTLRKLDIFYISPEASFFNISVSADGGKTFGQTRPITTEATNTQLRTTIGLNLSGDDLRVKFEFPEPSKILIISIAPRLVDRSEIILNP